MGPTSLDLYRSALQGDTAAYVRCAFSWLRRHLSFDAGMVLTTLTGRVAFIDAHFTGFADPAALMAAWQLVMPLDALPAQLLMAPGVVRCRDLDDPAIASPGLAPLREHLERFACRHSLGIALQGDDPQCLTLLILVRRSRGSRATPTEQATLQRLGPALAESYAACRSMALLRHPAAGTRHLCIARADRHGAVVQATPAFAQAFWPGTAPHDLHLPADALIALRRGQPWALPGRRLALHGQPDADGWTLQARPVRAADVLSPRQREIALRFANGEPYTTIAQALALAPATVRNHLRNIYARLEVRHRAGLIDALR